MRADQLLVERGLAASRSQAQRLIAAGARWRAPTGWRPLAKADDLPADAELELLDAAEARYVSRGGLKLEGALAATRLDVRGWQCLDVGQSTGGFTDCLLQHGAARVVGVDVGQGQLHPRLRTDARVQCLEQCNARHLTASDLIAAGAYPASAGGLFDANSGFDLVTGDLSFISLTLVLPALAPLVKPGGALLMLVKPQFELQPAQIGKGGIVRDPLLYALVEQRIRAACTALGACRTLGVESENAPQRGQFLPDSPPHSGAMGQEDGKKWAAAAHSQPTIPKSDRLLGLTDLQWLASPIAGGDGNREFFIFARRGHELTPTQTASPP